LYPSAPATTPPAPPIPTLSSIHDNTRNQYYLFGQPYPGKICLDIGFNTEDLLLTLKSAVNWKDCYKNLLYTFTDFSNWLGPKAQWIDFCDFHTDEDFLIYSYNPFGINKDTGDVTMLWFHNKINLRSGIRERRPTYGKDNYYRDCLIVDDSFIKTWDWQFYSVLESIGSFLALFNIRVFDYIIPHLAQEDNIGEEST